MTVLVSLVHQCLAGEAQGLLMMIFWTSSANKTHWLRIVFNFGGVTTSKTPDSLSLPLVCVEREQYEVG